MEDIMDLLVRMKLPPNNERLIEFKGRASQKDSFLTRPKLAMKITGKRGKMALGSALSP
jgi:hypothetical protein